MNILSLQIFKWKRFSFVSKGGRGGRDTVTDQQNEWGVSGIGAEILWGSPSLASDPNSETQWCWQFWACGTGSTAWYSAVVRHVAFPWISAKDWKQRLPWCFSDGKTPVTVRIATRHCFDNRRHFQVFHCQKFFFFFFLQSIHTFCTHTSVKLHFELWSFLWTLLNLFCMHTNCY